MKNPYEPGTPEWQLFENANSNRLNSITQAKMADDHAKQSQKCRETAQRYEAALKTLDGNFKGFEW